MRHSAAATLTRANTLICRGVWLNMQAVDAFFHTKDGADRARHNRRAAVASAVIDSARAREDKVILREVRAAERTLAEEAL